MKYSNEMQYNIVWRDMGLCPMLFLKNLEFKFEIIIIIPSCNSPALDISFSLIL